MPDEQSTPYELRAEIDHLTERLVREGDDFVEAKTRWEIERRELIQRAEEAEDRLRKAVELAAESDVDMDWRRKLRHVVGLIPVARVVGVTDSRPVCRRCSCCAKWSVMASGVESKNAQLRNELHVWETKSYRSLIGVWDESQGPFGTERDPDAGESRELPPPEPLA